MPQYELNLRDYIRIFHKRKALIIFIFLAVTFSSFWYVSRQPVLYNASVTIKIEQRNTIAGLLTEWIVYNPADIMESEPKIIKGFTTMEKVAGRLKLLPDNAATEDINAVVGDLQSKIETERVPDTNMIRIIATDGDARKAMQLANTVAEVYIQESLADKAKQARQTREFIAEQLGALESRLGKFEEELQGYNNSDSKVTMAEPIKQKLVELEFQLAELLQKYTDKHPRVMQLREQIKDIESQVQGFSSQEIEYAHLNREIEVNKKLYGMFKEKLEEARIAEAQKVGDISIVDPAVMPGSPIAGNRNMMVVAGALMGLVLGFALSFIFENLDTSISTIEDVENVIKLPVLGVVPSLEDDLAPEAGILERLKARFIPLPKTDAQERKTRLVAHFKPQSPVTEAYRNIHTNLKLDSTRKTILVTSSSPREGKSTVVSNLGIVMGQTGLKTLLVSADLRRPVLAKAFGIRREPGLTELIMGTQTLDNVLNNITDILLGDLEFDDIRKTPGLENVWIIPSGKLPANPVELLDTKSISKLVEMFSARFDVIVFDAPPVLPVTDASMLAPKMDATIIVYEIGRTSREALLRTKIQLESVGAKVAGVILNHTKPQTEAMAIYPYYSQKYRYYTTEGSQPEDAKKKAVRKA